MAKTRSQTSNITVKKEEEDIKDTQLLHSVNNTARNNKKITKPKVSRIKSNVSSAQEVKVEEDIDTKSLLKSTPKYSKLPKGQKISQEQINQLIDYVVNDKMSIRKAAPKANISQTRAQYYYNEYKNDPDHSIPIPCSDRRYTQDQKSELIRYIIDDKMNITQASKKAKIHVGSGIDYCRKYFKNQRPDIPTPSHIVPNRERYTQKQIKEVIGYIINDKMSINAASRKANMTYKTARNHYRRYLKDSNIEIPLTKYSKRYTQHQKNEFIGYIVEDKMSITAASKKANITASAGHNYYHKYLKENNIEASTRRYTQEQINEVIGYIVDDKMSITAASKKANMSQSTGSRHYRQYLNDQKL